VSTQRGDGRRGSPTHCTSSDTPWGIQHERKHPDCNVIKLGTGGMGKEYAAAY
jgi:hypothetical protein